MHPLHAACLVVITIATTPPSNSSDVLPEAEKQDSLPGSASYMFGAVGFVVTFGAAFVLVCCYISKSKNEEVHVDGADSSAARGLQTTMLSCKLGHALRYDRSRANACKLCGTADTAFRCSSGCDWDVCQKCFDAFRPSPAKPCWDAQKPNRAKVYPASVLQGAEGRDEGSSGPLEQAQRSSVASRARKACRQEKANLKCCRGHVLKYDRRSTSICDVCSMTGTTYHCSDGCDWDACRSCWDAYRRIHENDKFIEYLQHAYTENGGRISKTGKMQSPLRRAVTISLGSCDAGPTDQPYIDCGDAMGGWVGTVLGSRPGSGPPYVEGSDANGTCSGPVRQSSTPVLGVWADWNCGPRRAQSERVLSIGEANKTNGSDVRSCVDEELLSTLYEDMAQRRRNFKFLSARWHPDKHPAGDVALATDTFQYIQEQKSWYLEERE